MHRHRRSVAIVGLGRLGLCQALTFEAAGCDVLGTDVHPAYVRSINEKTLQSSEPGVEKALQRSQHLRATESLQEALDHSNLILILVATPTGIGEHCYDTGTLSNVLEQIAKLQPKDKHLVVCCTVPPGYLANVGSELIAECERCTLSYNPEFIAQGRILAGLREPEIVLIGEGSPAAGDALQSLYESCTANIPRICRMSPASAEIAKLSLNCFVTTKIAFANMIADIADRTQDADKLAILDAIGADSRVGIRCLLPGYGFGGPCFPRDNRALGQYASLVGAPALLCGATDEANKRHTQLMAQTLLEEEKERYVVEDVAFRPRCPADIIEESQPLEVAKALARAGKRVVIRDRPAILGLVRRTYGRKCPISCVHSNPVPISFERPSVDSPPILRNWQGCLNTKSTRKHRSTSPASGARKKPTRSQQLLAVEMARL